VNRSGSPRRGSLLLLAATLASLLGTMVAGYLTRLALVDADAWVRHTDEVKLAIDDCELAFVRGDAQELRRAEAHVEQLTLDNPLQQQNVVRATLLAEQGARAPAEELFASMQIEENRLMVERLQRIGAARARSSVAFVVAATLTIVFGAGVFSFLRAQRRDLERQRALLEAIIESVNEGIIAIEPSRNVIAINAVARSMWGGAAPRDRWPEDWRPVLQATYEDGSAMKPEDGPLARALRGETSKNVVYRVASAASPGGGVWVSASARPIGDGLGHTVAAVTTLRDITEQREQAEKLRDQSLTDELTGLLNRRGFVTTANARIAEARRTKAPMALLYADVNGLKRINDELGHEQGDRVIEDAARALRVVFRGADIVARIGGDEFVALLPNFVPSARDALLERLASAIRAHEQEGRPFRLSMSYGVTFMDGEGEQSLDELLADADRRMYARKGERREQSSPVVRAVRPDSKRG
jgi:diguanylate cyclase (GGDEF)-like protein